MSWRCSSAGRMLTQHETLNPSPVPPKQGEGVYNSEPRSGEVEAEKPRFEGLSWLHSKSEASLGFMR